MLYQALIDLVGVVPVGYEPLIYVISCVLLFWLVSTFFTLLWSLLSWIGGR